MTLPSAVLSTLRLPLRSADLQELLKESVGPTPRMAARLVLVTPRRPPAAAAGDCCRLHAWAWLRSRGGRPAGTPWRGLAATRRRRRRPPRQSPPPTPRGKTHAARLDLDVTSLGDVDGRDAAAVAAQAASLAVPLGGWAGLGRAAPTPESLLAPPPPPQGHPSTYAGDGAERVGAGGFEAPAPAHAGAGRGDGDGEGTGFPTTALGERWTMQAPTAGHAPTSQPPKSSPPPPPPPPPPRRTGGS
eukprot:TRINITY_DN4965_c1_g1_i1.p1 TRINITY_DN4965_c1_g1~~TRINITY_DN4965_c1_g1_i1.p1  ORF type:complete len:273 (-),score=51.62 TRINITY_DN4965_c1_g1_i1:192-926(-)